VKKFLLLVVFFVNALMVAAQIDSSAIGLSKFETIPTFNVYAVPDSTSFSNKNLRRNQPFIIMFFNPDCDHCINETKELMAYKNELKDVQILMVSISSYEALKRFYDEFDFASLPKIKIGQDVNYALGSLFQLSTFPSIFVYDYRGKLAKAFIGNIGIPAILAAIK
jgi:thiol-disulfide isomerase/thioredoxin